jgi:ADP-ribose pyrophosphatase
MPDEITLYESKWLGLYRIGHWDFARRPNSDACVGVLAITDEGAVVLVEQFRIPVGKRVIEIPAGLVGDEPEHRGEPLAETARRELMEETGFHAANIVPLLSSPTSAGMTSEFTHFFHATGLVRENQGGGTGGEDIAVHIVPLAGLRDFLGEKQAGGVAVDFKIHAAMAAAGIAY